MAIDPWPTTFARETMGRKSYGAVQAGASLIHSEKTHEAGCGVHLKKMGESFMLKLQFLVTLSISMILTPVLRHAQTSPETPVTAIDIALEPDATMTRHAHADNARLLKVYPNGYALDATHHAHVTMLQQFVRTATLTNFTPL